MATQPPNIQRLNCRLTAVKRWHPEQDTTALEQELACARITKHVTKIMASVPALSATQIADISALMGKAGA